LIFETPDVRRPEFYHKKRQTDMTIPHRTIAAAILCLALLCVGPTACAQSSKRQTTTDQASQPAEQPASQSSENPQSQSAPREPFRLPDIPDVLTTPADRAAYLTLHYWDHFDFADTTLIGRPEITEQAFVDFINVLPHTPREHAQAAVDTLVGRSLVCKEMFYHFIELADKYLYEPNSPMYNEELHILALRAIVNNPRVEDVDKIRPRSLLEIALRNRPGDVAADFVFTRRDGSRGRLSEIKAEYLLLYFNDPECDECRTMKDRLAISPVLNRLLESGHLKLLSVCVEGRTEAWKKAVFPARWIDACDVSQHLTRDQLYDLKAMPTLYLLDAQKRVILKDAPIEHIETQLSE